MKQIISIILFLITFLNSGNCSSQDRIIYGSVTAFDIIPVIRAEVFVKSSKKTVYTDSLGNFVVSVNTKDKLTISAEGFSSENIKIKDEDDSLFIDLKIKRQDTDLALNSGHISSNDELIFNSKVSVFNNDEDYSSYTDVYEIFKDKFRSVIVTEGSGTPHITIGYSSSMSGNDTPIIEVDGVILLNPDLSSISTKDIKSIRILKPGAESSIYGSQGGNGAIQITTKRGEID